MKIHAIHKEVTYPTSSLRQSILVHCPSAHAMCLALAMAFILNLVGAITAQAQPKWHPGHYVFALDTAPALLAKIEGKPQWKGIKTVYDWRDLETDQSSATNRIWNFSEIRADYNAAAAAGKYMVIMIRYKVFNAVAVANKAAPKWVYDNNPESGVVQFISGNGTSEIDFSRIWIPWVRQAFKDLLVALAAEFENKPFFEGIQFEETALSGVDGHDTAFSRDAYRDALIQNMKDAKAVFITSNVWQQANYNGGDTTLMRALYQNAFNVGGGISGPDTFMTGATQSHDELVAGDWFGKIPLSLDHQRPALLFDGYTPSQLFLRVTEVYQLNHVMWNAQEDIVPTPGTWGAKWGFTEAHAMLTNPPNGYAPFYVKSARPLNLLTPASLTATAVAATQVNTSWPDVTGETQYRLERKTETGAFGPLTTKPLNSTAHNDTTVVANTSYTYRIRGENAAGESAWRVSNSVTTPGGNTLYEAENGVLGGAATKQTFYAGYSGTAYVQMDAGATIQWTVSPGAGNRTMIFRFGCSGTKDVEIRVNGSVVDPSHSFVGSGRGTWLNSNVPASFTSGANTIKITRLAGSGAVDIDYVRIQ